MDRSVVEMLCEAYDGTFTQYDDWKHRIVCELPELGFTLSLWVSAVEFSPLQIRLKCSQADFMWDCKCHPQFHFGQGDSEWHNKRDPPWPVGKIEDRLAGKFSDMARRHGNPDLVIYTSGLWGEN
jgi:hypothetical protein